MRRLIGCGHHILRIKADSRKQQGHHALANRLRSLAHKRIDGINRALLAPAGLHLLIIHRIRNERPGSKRKEPRAAVGKAHERQIDPASRFIAWKINEQHHQQNDDCTDHRPDGHLLFAKPLGEL